MIRYRFHPEALDEANAAASFYEDRAKGLGLRFINELDETIDRIRANPFITARWTATRGNVASDSFLMPSSIV